MSAGKRAYLLFYLAGLAVIALAGWLQRAPGYMDADYYYAGGLALLKGGGLSQPFLWNYLDMPAGLPKLLQFDSVVEEARRLIALAGEALQQENHQNDHQRLAVLSNRLEVCEIVAFACLNPLFFFVKGGSANLQQRQQRQR